MTCDGGIKGSTHGDVVSDFVIKVGVYIKSETLLTHDSELHLLERFNQIGDLFRTIGSSSVRCRSGSHSLRRYIASSVMLFVAIFD